MQQMKRNESGQFLPGTSAGPGRPLGLRNKPKSIDWPKLAAKVANEPLSEEEAVGQLRELRKNDLHSFLDVCGALGVLGSPADVHPEPVC